jgi:hypothetical protein
MKTVARQAAQAGNAAGWIAAMMCLAALAASCGGDGAVGVGGSGAPPVGFGEGTITEVRPSVAAGTATAYSLDGTGFVVDGKPIEQEVAPGDFIPAQIKVGQHVETDFRVAGVSDAVRIEAQAVGQVSAALPDSFGLLGQRIRINTDPQVGPLTVFDGYSGAGEVRAGDFVEVHGLSIREPDGIYALQASRVERLEAPPVLVRLSGVIRGLLLSSAGAAFSIGEQRVEVAASTAGFELLSGVRDETTTVVVFGRLVARSGSAPVLQARGLRLTRRINFGVEALFGGTLTRLDPVAKTFEVNGVPVRFGTAVVNGAGPTERQYVRMQGNFQVDGSFDAAQITPIVGVALGNSDPALGVYVIEGQISRLDGLRRTLVVQGYAMRYLLSTDVRRCRLGFIKGDLVRVQGHVRPDGTLVADEVVCARNRRGDSGTAADAGLQPAPAPAQ